MSGSWAEPLASLVDGVTVCDHARSPVTAMTARLLNDVGIGSAALEDADIVLADGARSESGARADSIWVAVTPFGLDGPRSSWRASDLGVMASSGNMYSTGDPDRAPVRSAGNASYAHAASETAFAVLTALAGGRRPADVDVSMQEVVLVANMGAAGRYFRGGNRGRRLGANIGRTREIWPTKDGWVSCGLRGGKARLATLETLAKLVGDPALIERDWTQWDTNTASDDELREVEQLVGDWFATRTTAELYEIASETNIMLAPVNSPRELYASAQLAAREFFDPTGVPRKWAHFQTRRNRGPRPTPIASRMEEGAWSGTNILEFGAGAAGPIATRYFAEHGATVLRVESASRPDFLRTGTYGDMFDALNCGKRSVTLNLKHPDGLQLAKRLAFEWADAVQENFAPRAMRGLGLSYDDLVADKPDLVMISACLNGQTGPHRDYPGFGGQGAALSGFNYLTGWPDREPIGPFGTITDSLAPRFVATALAAALLHHRATGNGVYVDLSQVECAAWTLSDWLLAYKRAGVIGERLGNGHPAALLHGVYECAGKDRWVAIACWTEQELASLWAVVGSDGDLESWTRERDALDVATELQAAGVEAVPVQDFADVDADPQIAARDHWVFRDHPELGPGKYERNGFRIEGESTGYDRAGATLGQDTDWVLGELLGLTTTAQQRLREDGALT
ncbi:MAG TPA: CoA transferase [Acidimicrobiales bacterium]|nr:CoA transferase [Acidimicrobiales bacterium]